MLVGHRTQRNIATPQKSRLRLLMVDTFLLLQLIATAVAGVDVAPATAAFASDGASTGSVCAQVFLRNIFISSPNIDNCIAGPIVCIHLLVSFLEREQIHLALHI